MCRVKILLSITCMLLIAWSATAGSAFKQVRVENAGKRVYLVSGGDRILLEDGLSSADSSGNADPVRLSGGYGLEIVNGYWKSDLIVSYKNKAVATLSLDKFADQWLDNDKLWRDHADANQMRFMHHSAGGLSLFLGNIIPQGQPALAILSWRENGPSVRPITAQHLVRIRVGSKPSIDLLRRLDFPGNYAGYVYWYSIPRLVQFGHKLLLYTIDSKNRQGSVPPQTVLMELSADGSITRGFAKLSPGFYPLGVLNSQYIILGNPDKEGAQRLHVFDIRSKMESILPGDWSQYDQSSQVSIPATGNTLLVNIDTHSKTDKVIRQNYLVTVPKGQRKVIPTKFGQRIWKGMALVRYTQTLSIYNTASGKLIKTLNLYPRKKALILEFFRAIEQNNRPRFQQLLKIDPSLVNSRNDYLANSTPLHEASLYSWKELVDELLSKGADVNAKDDNGITSFGIAAMSADVPTIQRMLDMGADISARDNEGRTPLSWAVRGTNSDVAELLVKKGADLYSKNSSGETMAYYALVEGASSSLLDTMKRVGYHINARNTNGETLMFGAVRRSAVAWISLLVDAGADINARDAKGFTPLHYAQLTSEHKNVVSELLKYGATE